EWNWQKPYADFINQKLAGQTLGHFVRGGIPEGFVKMSPLNAVVSDAAKKQFNATLADINKGGFAIIKGPMKDNTGKVVVAAGKTYPEDAIELESMDYLLE